MIGRRGPTLLAAILSVAVALPCGATAAMARQDSPAVRQPDPEAVFEGFAHAPADLAAIAARLPQAAIDEVAGQLISAETDPHWQSAGIDLIAILRGRSGGLAGNILVADDVAPQGFYAGYFVDSDPRRFVRPSWVLVGHDGELAQGEQVHIDVASYSRAIKVVVRYRSTAVGTARCSRGGETWIYRDTSAPVTQEDLELFAALPALNRAFRGLELCTYYVASGDTLTQRVVTRDGRRVLEMAADALRHRLAPISESPFPIQR